MFFTFQRQTQTEGVDRDSERTRTEHQTCVFKESPKNPHPSLQHHDTVTDPQTQAVSQTTTTKSKERESTQADMQLTGRKKSRIRRS